MKKIIAFLLLINILSLGFLPGIVSSTAHAAECENQVNFLGIPPWYNGLCKSGTSDIEIDKSNPVGSISIVILNIIAIAIRLGGYVAVGFIIWGGIKYITAAGDSSKIASAKKTITNALIGLLIAFSAVAIVTFIVDGFS